VLDSEDDVRKSIENHRALCAQQKANENENDQAHAALLDEMVESLHNGDSVKASGKPIRLVTIDAQTFFRVLSKLSNRCE